jgi:hypothetical protein
VFSENGPGDAGTGSYTWYKLPVLLMIHQIISCILFFVQAVGGHGNVLSGVDSLLCIQRLAKNPERIQYYACRYTVIYVLFQYGILVLYCRRTGFKFLLHGPQIPKKCQLNFFFSDTGGYPLVLHVNKTNCISVLADVVVGSGSANTSR